MRVQGVAHQRAAFHRAHRHELGATLGEIEHLQRAGNRADLEIERAVKDPDLGFVTITDVRVTPDLTQARLFYTVLGGQEELEQSKMRWVPGLAASSSVFV